MNVPDPTPPDGLSAAEHAAYAALLNSPEIAARRRKRAAARPPVWDPLRDATPAEEARFYAEARADLRCQRARAGRVCLARRPVRCARARESRPRATPRRSPRSPRGPPDDGDPEPASPRPSPVGTRPWRPRSEAALRDALRRLPRLAAGVTT